MMGKTERVSESENMMSHVRLAQTLQAGYVNTPRSVASWTQQTPRLSNPSACCCATLFSLPSHGFSHARSLPSSFPRSPSYSLSLPGEPAVCAEQACMKPQHHSQGGKNTAKKPNPVENERSKINKHTDAELRKLSFFWWRDGTNLSHFYTSNTFKTFRHSLWCHNDHDATTWQTVKPSGEQTLLNKQAHTDVELCKPAFFIGGEMKQILFRCGHIYRCSWNFEGEFQLF